MYNIAMRPLINVNLMRNAISTRVIRICFTRAFCWTHFVMWCITRHIRSNGYSSTRV